MKRMNNEKGFTLVELMIVVAIIGILAAIAIPQFNTYRKKGYVATINGDCKNAFTASTSYISDNPSAAAMTLQNLKDNGYVPSKGVTTTIPTYTNTMTYTIQAKGDASWGLPATTDFASMTSAGVFTPAAVTGTGT